MRIKLGKKKRGGEKFHKFSPIKLHNSPQLNYTILPVIKVEILPIGLVNFSQ
jgi:hypothetical protein